MSKLFLTTLIALFSASAFADDSAFPRIDVKSITPGPLKPGEKITFSGKNSRDFFNMLPATVSVSKAQDKITKAHYRNLTMVSGAYALDFNCADQHYDDKTGNSVPNTDGVECTVQIEDAKTIEGDSFPYKPSRACRP